MHQKPTHFVHPSAIIEEGVEIGADTRIFDNVHIRRHAKIGKQCIVGGKTLIAYEVQIGDRCKINSNVYICYGVTIKNGVMISAGTVFTNDLFPRATTPDLGELRGSEPDQETRFTVVQDGATIGAGCIIGSDLHIGRFAMIGMGSVVTKSIPDFHLAIGSPAKTVGFVCRCGPIFARLEDLKHRRKKRERQFDCHRCNKSYYVDTNLIVTESELKI